MYTPSLPWTTASKAPSSLCGRGPNPPGGGPLATTICMLSEYVLLVAQTASASPSARLGPNTHAGPLTGMARLASRFNHTTLLPHTPRLMSLTASQNPSRPATRSSGSPYILTVTIDCGFASASPSSRPKICVSLFTGSYRAQ
jgi:hypothetical protein